jgi:DNA-binding MarR family transcriptional regulator
MQGSAAAARPRARSSEELAARLDEHWLELGRFITVQRLRSAASGAGDLTSAQLQALVTLAGNGLRMSELAGRLGVSESTATRLVDRLEMARLVRRTTSPPDRRCVLAELTPSGRKLAGELEASRRQYLAEILNTLQGDERRELVRLLAKAAGELRRREDARPKGKAKP